MIKYRFLINLQNRNPLVDVYNKTVMKWDNGKNVNSDTQKMLIVQFTSKIHVYHW